MTTSALLLLGIACGPPQLSGDGHIEGESGGESSGSDETSGADESTESTESTDDGTETNLPGFVPLYDEGTTEQCDPFMQDCPEGEKCVPYSSTGGSWDANKCAPVMGDQAPGEPCHYTGTDSHDDCDETSFCWDAMDIDGEPIGVCILFCIGSADTPQCPPMSHCQINDGGGPYLCLPTCDPIVQNCSEGLACFWANNGFECIFPTQDIPPGEPCGYINDCVGGCGCITAELLPNCNGSACCSPWCRVGLGDAQCAAIPGTSCVPFFEQGMAPAGYEDVGVCMLP